MRLGETTTPAKEQRLLLERTTVAARGTTPACMDGTQNELRKMSPSDQLRPAPRVPPAASQANRYLETREPWTVSYEGDGIRSYGRVLGFSEAGWHIVGEAAVRPGTSLTLRVHRPSATVQTVQGRAFVIRVQLHAAS